MLDCIGYLSLVVNDIHRAVVLQFSSPSAIW